MELIYSFGCSEYLETVTMERGLYLFNQGVSQVCHKSDIMEQKWTQLYPVICFQLACQTLPIVFLCWVIPTNIINYWHANITSWPCFLTASIHSTGTNISSTLPRCWFHSLAFNTLATVSWNITTGLSSLSAALLRSPALITIRAAPESGGGLNPISLPRTNYPRECSRDPSHNQISPK